MGFIKNSALIVILFFSFYSIKAQSKLFEKADSLKNNNLKTAYLNELHYIFKTLDVKTDEGAILKVNIKILEYYRLHDFNKDSIEKYYHKGMYYSKLYNNNEYRANFSFMWADYQVSKGNYTEALNMFQSLENEIEKNNYPFLPHFYDSFAQLFYYLNKHDKAFEYLKREVKIFEQRIEGSMVDEKKRIKRNISAVYNNLGILYNAQKERDSSFYYHQKAQEINIGINDTLSIIKSYNNIGKSYFDINDFVNAEKNYLKAYNFSPDKATNSLLNNYASLLFFQGENRKAENFLLKVIHQSENKEILKSALHKLVVLKKSEKNFEQALQYQEELNITSQKILDETKIKEIERLQISFEIEKKEQKILTLQEVNEAQQIIIIKNKWIVSIAVILLFLTILIFILYTRNKNNLNKINTLQMQQSLLRSQMNPHFIFNALSNIQTNILKNENEKAVKYLIKFSKLLRYNLEHTNLNKTIFSNEIQTITDYLDMQNLRLDGKLNYEINIDKSINEELITIPAMMLQPIIENAIEHGLESIENPTIKINITDLEKYIQCVIIDNGVGYSSTINKEGVSKKSIATKIIKERLDIFSKKVNFTLNYSIGDIVEKRRVEGTKVIIDLPILE